MRPSDMGTCPICAHMDWAHWIPWLVGSLVIALAAVVFAGEMLCRLVSGHWL